MTSGSERKEGLSSQRYDIFPEIIRRAENEIAAVEADRLTGPDPGVDGGRCQFGRELFYHTIPKEAGFIHDRFSSLAGSD